VLSLSAQKAHVLPLLLSPTNSLSSTIKNSDNGERPPPAQCLISSPLLHFLSRRTQSQNSNRVERPPYNHRHATPLPRRRGAARFNGQLHYSTSRLLSAITPLILSMCRQVAERHLPFPPSDISFLAGRCFHGQNESRIYTVRPFRHACNIHLMVRRSFRWVRA